MAEVLARGSFTLYLSTECLVGGSDGQRWNLKSGSLLKDSMQSFCMGQEALQAREQRGGSGGGGGDLCGQGRPVFSNGSR